MAGNRISHLGEHVESNEAVRLSYANELNLRTLQASATSVLEKATAAANTAVSNAITNHANTLN